MKRTAIALALVASLILPASTLAAGPKPHRFICYSKTFVAVPCIHLKP